VNVKVANGNRWLPPLLGGVLAAVLGLALRIMPLGQSLVLTSYDELFRFSARDVTNVVSLVQLDGGIFQHMALERSRLAELLNRLADDGCPLVVMDILFQTNTTAEADQLLAEAMRRQRALVLARELVLDRQTQHPIVTAVPIYPAFTNAVTSWGVAGGEGMQDEPQRQHWPFENPQGQYPSLAWQAARLAGTALSAPPEGAWLRYYGRKGDWTSHSLESALRASSGVFGTNIVFIGARPISPDPGVAETDKFLTPYSRRFREAVGGVEINVTQFLNLMNGDWLRRWPGWAEALILLAAGLVPALLLRRLGRLAVCGVALAVMASVYLASVSWSFFSNHWFPYLLVVGVQVPFVLAWTLATPWLFRWEAPSAMPSVTSEEQDTEVIPQQVPEELEDYERFGPPFGEGAFGQVWVVRSAIGEWLALKQVYHDRFGPETSKFEMELEGIRKYKPISHQHPGLLRIDFVSRKRRAGYFYYVMELGDSREPGWETDPGRYRPRDLKTACQEREGGRLPLAECLELGVKLADALDFLHRQGLTHRDIKPSNIIFVGGEPKLADVGTITNLRTEDQIKTMVGSLGYMPPPGEPPGTRQADLFSLGMVLYVISTGRDPVVQFPEVSTIWVEEERHRAFSRVIHRACHPDPTRRYASAAEMKEDMEKARVEMGTM